MSQRSPLCLQSLPMHANMENRMTLSNSSQLSHFGPRKSFGLVDSNVQSSRKTPNKRSFSKTPSREFESGSKFNNSGSRWHNLNISELHENPCKVLKSLRSAPKRNPASKSNEKSDKNLAIRKTLREVVKQNQRFNHQQGNEIRLVELYKQYDFISSPDQLLISLCESFNSFMAQREATMFLLQIPLYESKSFDHKLVHNSLTLYNMLVELIDKQIHLSEIDHFIATSRGCDGFFGQQKMNKFNKAVGLMKKVVFQSPCKKTIEVAQLMATVKKMIDEFTASLWTFNVLSSV